jgi:predicted dehydrogenase
METNRRSFLTTAGISALMAGTSTLEAQSEQKPIRLAIIGTGHRGWAHLAILKNMPQFQVVALADPTPTMLDRGATFAPGAKTYSDYNKMLSERNDIDAVVVITPSFLHSEVSVAALNKGLPVLCEKPMATTIEDANRMIEASKKNGKLLYIGFQKRLLPATAKMKELAAAGAIGRVEMITGCNFRNDWNPESWKYTDPKTGVSTNWRYLTFTEGSALLEDGIHELDALNWIANAGKIARVTAAGGNNVFKNRETVDHLSTIIEYESGTKMTFELCLFAPNAGPGTRRMTIIGSEGVMTPENGRVVIRGHKPGEVKYVDAAEYVPKAVTAYAVGSAMDAETYKQYLEFEKSVRNGAPPPVSPEDGKTTIKMVLLAEKSLRTHKIMTWSDLPA